MRSSIALHAVLHLVEPLVDSPSQPSAATEVSGLVTVSSDFLGLDPDEELDDPAEDHDRSPDDVADVEPRRVGAVTDQRAVEDGAERSKICAMAKNTAIASARISMGHVSLTVR